MVDDLDSGTTPFSSVVYHSREVSGLRGLKDPRGRSHGFDETGWGYIPGGGTLYPVFKRGVLVSLSGPPTLSTLEGRLSVSTVDREDPGSYSELPPRPHRPERDSRNVSSPDRERHLTHHYGETGVSRKVGSGGR